MPQPGHCSKLAQAAIAAAGVYSMTFVGARWMPHLGLHSLHDDGTVILAFVPMLARVLIRRALVPSLCLGEAAEFQDCNTLDTPSFLDLTAAELSEEFDGMAGQKFGGLLGV
jgi:hypothetical protein